MNFQMNEDEAILKGTYGGRREIVDSREGRES
jgi:hypothetical protein